jgi:hypothetical protein
VQALLRLDQDPVRVSGTESLSEQQETTLRGIRKTQVRLAAYRVSGTESLQFFSWFQGLTLPADKLIASAGRSPCLVWLEPPLADLSHRVSGTESHASFRQPQPSGQFS